MKEVKMYECEYCGKRRYKTKKPMTRHEDSCYFNPKNKACVTCKYFYNNQALTECCANVGIDISEKLKYKCNNWKQK